MGNETRTQVELRCSAVVPRGEELLLVRHVRSDGAFWVLPGGHVHDREIASSAAEREVKEETGIDVGIGRVLFTWDGIDHHDGRRVLELVFHARMLQEEQQPGQGNSGELPRFFPIDDLPVDLYPPIAGYLRGTWKRGFRESAPYLGNVWRRMGVQLTGDRQPSHGD